MYKVAKVNNLDGQLKPVTSLLLRPFYAPRTVLLAPIRSSLPEVSTKGNPIPIPQVLVDMCLVGTNCGFNSATSLWRICDQMPFSHIIRISPTTSILVALAITPSHASSTNLHYSIFGLSFFLATRTPLTSLPYCVLSLLENSASTSGT